MVPEGTVVITRGSGNAPVDEDVLISLGSADTEHTATLDSDDIGEYIELCFTDGMAGVILAEDQFVGEGEVATMRVYMSSEANNRAVVVKEDDLLTKAEMQYNAKDVKVWLKLNQCVDRLSRAVNLFYLTPIPCHPHFVSSLLVYRL